MDDRKVTSETALPHGFDAPAANGELANDARLQHGSTNSLNSGSGSLGRALNPGGTSSDGYNTSATDDTQRPAAVSRAGALLPGASLEDVVQDSPFLDLSSAMTPYEWFKAVLLAPWALFRFIISVAGLVLVWAVTRVRHACMHTWTHH